MCPDHPREYGENLLTQLEGCGYAGPSPRIRGESHRLHSGVMILGTIPANTGRISGGAHFLVRTRDHPREYGENVFSPVICRFAKGSSPRIRGELHLPGFGHLFRGIIPANTGRMPMHRITHCPSRDHPREYGENRVYISDSARNTGSSPRIRGE